MSRRPKSVQVRSRAERPGSPLTRCDAGEQPSSWRCADRQTCSFPESARSGASSAPMRPRRRARAHEPGRAVHEGRAPIWSMGRASCPSRADSCPRHAADRRDMRRSHARRARDRAALRAASATTRGALSSRWLQKVRSAQAACTRVFGAKARAAAIEEWGRGSEGIHAAAPQAFASFSKAKCFIAVGASDEREPDSSRVAAHVRRVTDDGASEERDRTR